MGKTSMTKLETFEQKPYGTKLGKVVWWNGKLVNPDDCRIHVTAHSLHYGLAAFEGIRAYKLHNGKTGIFRCREHIERLLASCHTGFIRLEYSVDELVEACKLTVQNSGMDACYLRPIAFLDAGPLGVFFNSDSHPVSVAIMTMDWGKYLGADAMAKGSRLKISSFTRHHPNISMTKAKFTGNYINSVLAKLEARKMGFDEGLLLDPEGYLAEGSGENLFVVRKGKLYTPSVESVLEGITRDTVIHIARDLKLELAERRITRDELYNADEAFLCGTAAEITPIAEVDMRKIGAGKPGPVTKMIQERYFEIVTGKVEKYSSWISVV
jgi:branched-chain amino acid aminotransferase